jgi:hypothetical protein
MSCTLTCSPCTLMTGSLTATAWWACRTCHRKTDCGASRLRGYGQGARSRGAPAAPTGPSGWRRHACCTVACHARQGAAMVGAGGREEGADATGQMHFRSRAEVARSCDGLELLSPRQGAGPFLAYLASGRLRIPHWPTATDRGGATAGSAPVTQARPRPRRRAMAAGPRPGRRPARRAARSAGGVVSNGRAVPGGERHASNRPGQRPQAAPQSQARAEHALREMRSGLDRTLTGQRNR